MKHILKCEKCGEYTMQEKCPKCGFATKNPKPAKYDPTDKVGKYRRKAKENDLRERGLI